MSAPAPPGMMRVLVEYHGQRIQLVLPSVSIADQPADAAARHPEGKEDL